jgi:hypothetical protein
VNARDIRPMRFASVFCSQCGHDCGAGNFGFSECSEHRKERPLNGYVAKPGVRKARRQRAAMKVA